jgi:hypothetical protein
MLYMPSLSRSDALEERLNDLYWNSSHTIDDIVNGTGVTRNRLYVAIRPLEARGRCTECEGALLFNNRRSRMAGSAICSICGNAASLASPDSLDETGSDEDGMLNDGWERAEWGRNLRDRKKTLIGGAAALGLLIGAAATRVIKA